MEVNTIGLDPAKNVFQVLAINGAGEVVVMDNLPAHRVNGINATIEGVGAGLLYGTLSGTHKTTSCTDGAAGSLFARTN